MAPQHMNKAIWVAIVTACLSLASSVWLEWSHNDRVMAQDISTLKAHQVDNAARTTRIEDKIDQLMWFLGTGGPGQAKPPVPVIHPQ